MQESNKQAPSVVSEQKALDAPAAGAPTKPEAGLELPSAQAVLSDLLKAPEAAVESVPPSTPEAEGAASPLPAPPVASDLLKAPEAAMESVPPSTAEAEGAASPFPAPDVSPPPKAASDSSSPLSVLVSHAPNACSR